MSAPTVQPTEQHTTGDSDGLLHFGCVLDRRTARLVGTPVRCLCGVVQTASEPARGDSASQRCVVCLDLAPAHLAACEPCRKRVKA